MDKSRGFHRTDPLTALALLTRLPVRGARFERGARAAWAWPLAGLVVGGIAALAAVAAGSVGLPPSIVAGLGLAAGIVVTGAMHEDGLADSVDGIWGGWDAERRLAIMRDSRIGTYGVLALAVSLGLRWAALATLFGAGAGSLALIATAILSRAAMLPVAAALPHARGDGLAVTTGRPDAPAALAGLGLGMVLPLLLMGAAAIPALAAAIFAALAVGTLARRRIGGQTGDVLGATQQMAELAALLAFCAMLA